MIVNQYYKFGLGWSRTFMIIFKELGHLNYAISYLLWVSSFSNSFFNRSSSSIFSSKDVCFELISSLIIWTFEKYTLFLSYLLYNSAFFAINYVFLFSICYCRFLKSYCFFWISACFYITSLLSFSSSSTLVFSTWLIYFSKLSIYT